MAASAGSESQSGSGSAPGTVSAVVSEHLRRLGLREFPCGTGSWNRSRFLPPTRRAWKELVPGEVAMGPEEEPVEALLGLVRSPQSPWALPEDSSAEDQFLRELAIQSPLMIRDTFFYSYFRSLRVVDKQVSQVDRDLLKFLKLEELVLSANRIKEVDAANLPPTLKVLELYGNELGSAECLCAHPPPGLQHLGLGQNQLCGPSECLYVTASHWRGPLPSDLLPQEAQLLVTLGNIRGVVDSSVLDPEPGPEGPFVAYSYYVTYDFLEEEEEEEQARERGEASEYGGVLAKIVKPASSTELLGEEPAEDAAEESLESTTIPSSSAPRTVLFSTDHKPWADVIACSYEAQHSIRDLGSLKAFLLAGTTVTIVEEKILSWPAVTPPGDSPLAAKKGKGENEKKKKGKDGKDQRGKAQEAPKERDASHKKREAPKELRQDPPVLHVLGSGLVALEPLLAREPVVSTVCNFGVVRTLESDRLTFARDSKKIKKGAKKEKMKSAARIFESGYQPEPLTVEVEIQLSQVRSVEEACPTSWSWSWSRRPGRLVPCQDTAVALTGRDTAHELHFSWTAGPLSPQLFMAVALRRALMLALSCLVAVPRHGHGHGHDGLGAWSPARTRPSPSLGGTRPMSCTSAGPLALCPHSSLWPSPCEGP
ncbi:leucine-rich repeat-containing protein 43 [Fukomys damarensis]|uniref:leucine-rich repeat-containing protein 43 n=1 Tax=Fukomys damarensis TaxID=885580 RepID=UPI00053F9F4B|nr:leucine-rich repeat-containing protein 43 [Fukomys damarensis]